MTAPRLAMSRRALLAGAAALAMPAIARAQAERLRILLDWGWLPYHSSFFVAQERGYFREAGVEVEVEQGRGSNTTAIMVGQRAYDLGHVNITNAAAAIARGVPLKAVAVYQHRTSASFVGIKGRVTLSRPASLRGLRIGSTPGGSDGLSLTIFRRANSIPDNALNIISLDASSKTAALLTGQVDAVSGDSHAYSAIVRGAGQEPEVMELANFGVPLLGFGFAASEQAIREKPEAIRRALTAIRRAMADVATDTEAACTLIRSRVQIAGNMAQCLDYTKGLQALSTPPHDPGWGRSTSEEWRALIDTLQAAGEIRQQRPLDAYYTNDLLPR
ncbi:ABC transporter substrate-binding protein [Plastoroseomonas hellenica]|uniref:ABC transporter substrate-binding protein n=1 Tax=Plastoroseomonas hellenica TaxID=2687306 RepID=UPI001BA9AABB|nr:ABC transporter substrate-binding protein [Plastoroseomonas hellenica]MBR0646005.1 ABC transporter substrate-binding protein [Plastoroseomonas hellenica]